MQLEFSRVIDAAFRYSLAKLPYFTRFSPDIEILGDSDKLIDEVLAEERDTRRGREISPTFLDIGGADPARSYRPDGFEHYAMDLLPWSDQAIVADICRCPEVPSNSFDVVYSNNLFEHLKRPWDAARESIRLAKPGGLIIHRTLFAYRYHPEPVDFWRFSSQCLEHLFTSASDASTIVKGYDIRGRRRNRRGTNLNHRPPIDWLGGFRENWLVLWIGRKNP